MQDCSSAIESFSSFDFDSLPTLPPAAREPSSTILSGTALIAVAVMRPLWSGDAGVVDVARGGPLPGGVVGGCHSSPLNVGFAHNL